MVLSTFISLDESYEGCGRPECCVEMRPRLLLSEPLRLRWDALCARFGVTRVALCESSSVVGPAMVGLRTVLLPSEFIGKVEARDLDAALAHELAHVQRNDFAKNVAYAVLMLPVAYHPCAWLLQKACDGKPRDGL